MSAFTGRTSHQIVFRMCVLLLALAQSFDCLAEEGSGVARLAIRLVDADTGQSLSGLVRVSRRSTGVPVKLPELIERYNGWYTSGPSASVTVPATELTIEAFHGLETTVTEATIFAAPGGVVELKMRRFHDARAQGWHNANTHLHLMKRSRQEAERYLQEVPAGDGLELVYVSHLRRIPDEKDYITNDIVEQNWTENTLQRLSTKDVLLRPGEEHRHNFGRGGQGYGHVMLLDIAKLIQPVSIGPGIMREGTDSPPLKSGILDARTDGATVVWCHNANGFEDIPNWLLNTVHAQNIFDGGNRGSYADTFYRYLNLGMRIPFSTGTDWFVDDFSRVYVPLTEPISSQGWLAQLRAGRTFITNGPFLEFEVDGHSAGYVFDVASPKEVNVRARAVGRIDFQALELLKNGEVVTREASIRRKGFSEAEISTSIQIDEPSWLALRIPVNGPKNEFGKSLFAHTSPVYFDFRGRRPFRQETALQLITEIEESLQVIREKAVFAGDAESRDVMEVYQEGIHILRSQIAEHAESR